MDLKVKCEKCNNLMHQIGPFAEVKVEGQPAKKWDGVFDFECVNQECKNISKIVKIKLQ